jgi:hypothetical protein
VATELVEAIDVARRLRMLAAMFPEARFVITDRGAFRRIVSMAVLAEAIVDPFCCDS